MNRSIENSPPHGLEEVYAEYRTYFVRIAVSYVRDRMVAEDLVSDTFLKIWESRTETTPRNLPAYLLTALKRKCLDYLRDQAILRHPPQFALDDGERLGHHQVLGVVGFEPRDTLSDHARTGPHGDDAPESARLSAYRAQAQVSGLSARPSHSSQNSTEHAPDQCARGRRAYRAARSQRPPEPDDVRRLAIIERELRRMPEQRRRIFIAHRYEEMSYREIAAVYELSEGQVTYELRAAKEALPATSARPFPPQAMLGTPHSDIMFPFP